MKYIVVKSFVDMNDPSKTVYHDGDEFPRHGLTVSQDRIKELSTSANKMNVPLIKEVDDFSKKINPAIPAQLEKVEQDGSFHEAKAEEVKEVTDTPKKSRKNRKEE